MSDPLLSITNNHGLTCGDPPIVSNDEHTYVGYFENEHGEQWIFTVDRETENATLRGGDIGWNQQIAVVSPGVADVTLSKAESLWLQACWAAAFAFEN